MGLLTVIEQGVLSSVQGLGRVGLGHAGVARSGAFDTRSLRIGNRLLGNEETDAAIELTMNGGSFEVSASTMICLTGARAVNAKVLFESLRVPLRNRMPTVVPAGCTIEIGALSSGLRMYLCIAGGIQSELVMGSRSSLVSLPDAGLGGALRAGDELEFHALSFTKPAPSLSAQVLDPIPIREQARVLRVVPSVHTGLFSESQRAQLCDSVFQVSDQSNRAGVRLTGQRIDDEILRQTKSEGTLPGYVQVPASGEPIVLGVDGPTTGGYPVIACVIEADIPELGQCELRESVRFEWVTRETALQAMRDQEEMIGSVESQVSSRGFDGKSDA